jgi:ribosomal protein S12 methylthiotransferase
MSRVHLVTLGCPKNEVDSEKLLGQLAVDGYEATDDAEAADLVVVNTCAFIEEARQESIDTVLGLADLKAQGSRLVVTGCMAERYRQELADALPEVDVVAGFGESLTGATAAAPAGTPVTIGTKPVGEPVPAFDLLNLPRPRSTRPWAYVKVAEGCDRACGFCAIPSFRGPAALPVARRPILDEVDQLAATRDRPGGPGPGRLRAGPGRG